MNYKKNITLLSLEIKSFNKIHVNEFFIKDLQKLCTCNNISFLRERLKNVSNQYLYSLKSIVKKLYSYDIIYIKRRYLKLLLAVILSQLRNLKRLYMSLITNKNFGLVNPTIYRLPLKKKLIKTIKSPHVFKKSQDHYEIRHHKLIIKLPPIFWNTNFICSLLEQTTALNPMYRVNIKKKEVFNLSRIEKIF
uniref:Ribosomal protein S10 n=1 Tax=Pharyngomonas kirbyi TaxID=63601 RepID=A0A1W6R262_9EUKA|nr:ribosomal protein S10 [Pharyngomonas kirbyi]ARO47977.1 ribosomal protein S10 [Pharyngomonas kirbyi]